MGMMDFQEVGSYFCTAMSPALAYTCFQGERALAMSPTGGAVQPFVASTMSFVWNQRCD